MRTIAFLVSLLAVCSACLDDSWSISEEEEAVETATACKKQIGVHFAIYGFMPDPRLQETGTGDGKVDINKCWAYQRPQQKHAFTCGPAVGNNWTPDGIGYKGTGPNWHSWIYEDTAWWPGHEQEAGKVRICSEAAGSVPGGGGQILLKPGIEYMAAKQYVLPAQYKRVNPRGDITRYYAELYRSANDGDSLAGYWSPDKWYRPMVNTNGGNKYDIVKRMCDRLPPDKWMGIFEPNELAWDSGLNDVIRALNDCTKSTNGVSGYSVGASVWPDEQLEDPPDPGEDGTTYECGADDDCPSGTVCDAGHCVPGESGGGGDPGGCGECAIGTKRCWNAYNEQMCQDVNGDGCGEWAEIFACPFAVNCGGGYCGGTDAPPPPPPSCDTCDWGDAYCADGTTRRVCGDQDGNGCSDWSDWTQCGGSLICSSGQCVPRACEPGAHQCEGSYGWRFCSDLDWDTVYEWSEQVVACDPGTTCEGSECRRYGPGNLVAGARTASTVNLSWAPETGAASYEVYRGGVKIATTTATTHQVSGLACGTEFDLAVAARDDGGVLSSRTPLTVSTTSCTGTTVGCFADQSTRDVVRYLYQDGANTIEKCTAACQAAGYSYAGLQYGNQCFCDDNYGNHGKSTACTMTCSGNSGEICGGNWANSVYRVTEMVAGGGFEGTLTDWRALEAALDTVEKKVGASSLRLTRDGASGWTIASQDILARPGKRYAVTGWLRTRNAVQTHLKIDWFKSDGSEVDPTQPDVIAVLVDGTADWTRFSKQVTAPALASYGRLSLLGGWSADGAGPADSWWDEIEVEVVQRNAFPDLDGDGKTDVAVWRPVNGAWYGKDKPTVYWGQSGDLPVAGDYDGDGRTDIAVWRPSNGTWYLKDKPAVQWGLRGDVPVSGDYNGDGKTDLAFWRSSDGGWYVKDVAITSWGTAGDIPVPGDYNGDGRTDLAVWRPSSGTWYVKDQMTVQWGASGDVPVPADYNADGKTDIAFWRPSNGTWYVKDQMTVQWGWGPSGDIPAPSDHTGDGRADLVVYRPDGRWWVNDRVAGSWYAVAWGASGDHPIKTLSGGTPPNAAATLASGEALLPGQSRRSSDGRFLFQYQQDGNLVVYQDSAGAFIALWQSGTWGTSAGRALMQPDGKLVVLGGTGLVVWSAGAGNSPGARLVVQSDGNAVLLSASSAALWSTGTCCR